MAGASGNRAEPAPPRPWRWIAIDAAAFVVIAVAIFASHVSLTRHGMCFNDPSWYFHFGLRALRGDVPYRDYVFQVGPLPIYVDAGFQALFGTAYTSSLLAGLFIKSLRVSVVWMIARRIAGWRAAVALTVFCALEPLFAFAHHWSTPYAELFLELVALFLLLASRAAGRRAMVYCALAGASLALITSARQSTATLATVMLLVTTTVLLVRRDFMTPRRYLALWGGYAAGLIVLFGMLALAGALGPAIQQMFLDAPEKKAVTGIDAILDAISGGALASGTARWCTSCLFFIGVPSVMVAAALYLQARDREISAPVAAAFALPIALVFGLITRSTSVELITDVPRTFMTAVVALTVLAPHRLRRWFGLEPILAIAFAAGPLTADWALEMSFPGRGWGDAASLVLGTLLIALASSRIAARTKAALCVAFALAAALHVNLVLFRGHVNPFSHLSSIDGTLDDSRFPATHELMAGLSINESRLRSLAWLSDHIKPGSTCFMYGNLPVLYDLLDCKNPTLIDTTTADFITADDANRAIAAMRAHPPDYIVAQDKSWMSPPLTLDLNDNVARYGGLNPRASFAIHVGMRSLIQQYEHVGLLSEVLGPQLAEQSERQFDILAATHLYRRKP